MSEDPNYEQNNGFDAQEEAVQSRRPRLHLSPEFLAKRLHYCSKCRWIFENADLSIQDYPGKEYDFHNWAGLSDAAREGCHHCYVLLNTLDEEHILRLTGPDKLESQEKSNPLKLWIRSYDRAWTGTPGIMTSWELHSVDQKLYDIHLEPLEDGIDLSEAEGRFIECTSTDSEASWKQILSWVDQCSATHPSCNARIRQDSRDRKPTRLLFVGDLVNSWVNLCETKTLDLSRTDYMTLSHCWGDGVPLRLTHDNYNRFLAGIEFNEIPKTFRDAIDATRRLSVQYLWIDSLCIVQDSREDWLHESAKMHHIYQNSYLNLMAAASSNSHGGLYSSKYPFLSIPFLVPLGDPRKPKLAYYRYMNARREKLDNLTLFSRGWVMQERVLARRNLIFGKEIHWECHDSTGSESFPVGTALEKRQHTVEGETDASRRTVWQNIVKNYSCLNLTFASDRLIAIAGMAAELGQLWDRVQYYAGLWSLHLRASLLWYSRKPSVQAKSFIAPSWSWASVGTEVQWFDADDFDGLAEVFQVDVDLTSNGHPFGPVTRGSIHLNGPMCEARLVKTKYTEILCFDQDTEDTVSKADMTEDDDATTQSGFRTTVVLDHYPWSEQEMVAETDVDITVYLAPLQTDIDLKLTYSGLLRLGGLLLLPTGSISGQFRRIGHFFIHDQWGMEGRRVYEERIARMRKEGKIQQKDVKLPGFVDREEWLKIYPFGNGVITKTLRSRYISAVDLGYAGEISNFLGYIDRWAEEHRKMGIMDPNLGEEDVEAKGWYRYEIV
ncbi:HET domain-containing protein [Neurospora intermedia]|uniref:HET domain-containing protein n=1 Tax=Neurospora intermedia TaxID=5142 RepID=A0ABR3DSX7_NEUIN